MSRRPSSGFWVSGQSPGLGRGVAGGSLGLRPPSSFSLPRPGSAALERTLDSRCSHSPRGRDPEEPSLFQDRFLGLREGAPHCRGWVTGACPGGCLVTGGLTRTGRRLDMRAGPSSGHWAGVKPSPGGPRGPEPTCLGLEGGVQAPRAQELRSKCPKCPSVKPT